MAHPICRLRGDSALRAAFCLTMLLTVLATGCSRRHYRLQADREVNFLVQQKSKDPRWGYRGPFFNVNMDPRQSFP